MSKPEGYLFVDHRASPGIPEAKAQAMGLDPTTVSEGKVLEAATLTCAHCGTVVIVNPRRTRERGLCFQCMAYICDSCTALARMPDYVHMPMVKLKELVRAGKLLSMPQPAMIGDKRNG